MSDFLLKVVGDTRVWRRALAGVLLFSCCILPPSLGAQLKDIRRVLILNDLGIISSPGYAEIDRAILAVLQESSFKIELYQESLDLTLFPDEVSQNHFREEFVRKYSDRKPDVIIAAGSASLKFIVETHDGFVPNIPIIFCAIWGEIPATRLNMPLTGVLPRLRPEETLNTALHLLPDTKHVVVVGGMGKFDVRWEAIAKQSFHSYEAKMDFTYLNDLTMPTLLERLQHLPSNTIVVHTVLTQDAAGDRFIDATQSLPLVAGAANAPVFVMDDVDLNGGAVGGDLVNWANDSRVAAEMAVRVLNGEKPQDIPVVMSTNTYMFDWRALKRWGIKESALPPGSIVLNRQATFWEAYKRYIIGGTVVLLAQMIAIFALVWQRAQRRKAQIELRKSEQKFSKAFQRSPLSFTLASLIDYRLIEVNDTFERYTGWTRDEVIGRTSLQIEFWVDMKQRSTFIETLRANGAVQNQEILFRKKDGEVRTGVASSELIELNGEPCALSLMAEVTESKRAENARRESEQRFRLIANTAPVLIWMSGTDKLCNYFNQPWLDFTGCPLEAELGNGWSRGVHPDDLVSCMDTYIKSFDRHESFQMEYRLRRHDGEYRWVSDIGVPRFEPDGRFAGYIGSCVDITDRKHAEEAQANMGRRLIQAHEEERTWIARELHDDINQRLALLAIELEHFKQNIPEVATGSLEQLSSLRQRISDIGEDVQGLSHRLHSSKLEYLGLAAAASSFCKELSEQRKLEIEFTHRGIPRGLPKEISLALFRILQEALQNAAKYSGVRHFKAEIQGTSEEIQLTVSDLGTGFDVHEAVSQRGLGLISMRERVRLVNGELSVDSQPGRGTRISARVPLNTEEYRARVAG